MKQLLFLLLFPCLALAQYTGNAGQKITLGEQTTADGLVYRGVASIDTVTATSKITRANKQDTSAFLLLDTVTNLLWHYKTASNGWIQAGGGVSVSSFSAGTTGLTPSTATTGAVTLGGTLAVANGGTNASTFTAGSVVFAGASGTSLTQDNSNFFWNNSTKRLALGANSTNLISTNSVGIGDIQFQRTTFGVMQMVGFNNNADAGGYMSFHKARGASYSIPTTPNNNDAIGEIVFGTFTGSVNTNPWRTNVVLSSQVDGTVDSTSSPGRFSIQTTPIGSRSSLTRMTIKNDGNVGINTESPTEKLHVVGNGLFTGNLGVGSATPTTSGTGITFPATQSASTNVNTLDDYEEGTWTPTIKGSTIAGTYTPSTTNAYYTKIGNVVTVWCFVDMRSGTATGGTGVLLLESLPFSYKSGSAFAGTTRCDFVDYPQASSHGTFAARSTSGASSSIIFQISRDNADTESISITGFTTSSLLTTNFSYTTN